MPTRPLPFPAGTVLAGKYRVERLLGEGGMGWVVVATHIQLEQRVAVKFMHATDANQSSDAIARFLREARAAARIQSEHVARVSDFGTLENGAPYLVMEYLEGEDLESLLRKAKALPFDIVVDYATQACEGLAEAHAAGIVHRDLKPANLFLTRRIDGTVRVKLLDFGISKLAASGGADQVSMTSTQALMGSPLYMAPEQMRSSKNVDARADIWSMGVILYEMLGGRSPFDGETLPIVCARIMTETPTPLRQIKPDVPEALEAVVTRCLERDLHLRFQDVAALTRALAPLGSPEVRVVADRIGRAARARALSVPEIAHDDSLSDSSEEAMRRGASAGVVGQTRGTFSKTGSQPTSRIEGRTLAVIGLGALALAGIIVIGVFAMRGGSKTDASSAARVSTVDSASSTATATPTPITTATATATPTPITTPTPTLAPPSKIKSALPSIRIQPAASANANRTKPASTMGFGGRD